MPGHLNVGAGCEGVLIIQTFDNEEPQQKTQLGGEDLKRLISLHLNTLLPMPQEPSNPPARQVWEIPQCSVKPLQ